MNGFPKQNLNRLKSSSGQFWWLQILFPIFFTYLLARYLLDPEYFNKIFYGINLGFHEAGHYVVFRFFGDFIMTLGGSLLECLAPIMIGASFYRRGDFVAVSFCLGWLGTALFDTATYIADAREMKLELLFGSHDWNRLLSQMELLQYDNEIALAIRFLAVISMALGIIWGFSIVMKTFKRANAQSGL